MKRVLWVCCASLFFAAAASAATLKDVQHELAMVKYKTPGKSERAQKLDTLADEAAKLAATGDAEAEVWDAAVLALRAKLIGGTSALDDIRTAQHLLQDALASNAPSVKDGYANAILGALYGKAPGWPISFGDHAQAEKHFAAALARNPDGIDVNFLDGEYLYDRGEMDAAHAALQKAVAAKPRKGRELADNGRHAEAQALLDKIDSGN